MGATNPSGWRSSRWDDSCSNCEGSFCDFAPKDVLWILIRIALPKSVLTHFRLKELPHTIDWKILISVLGMSGYVI